MRQIVGVSTPACEIDAPFAISIVVIELIVPCCNILLSGQAGILVRSIRVCRGLSGFLELSRQQIYIILVHGGW
jgi:hypothetical protein